MPYAPQLEMFAITATFLYFQQAGIVTHSFSDRGAQTAFFATVDLVVNCLTLLVQLFFTGRIVILLGVGLALALLPALTMVGFGVLAFAPSLSTIAVFQILRRAGDYAIARPTRTRVMANCSSSFAASLTAALCAATILSSPPTSAATETDFGGESVKS